MSETPETDRIVWIDCEMTGLDFKNDLLVESLSKEIINPPLKLTDLKNEILKLSNLTIPLEVFVNTDIERIGLKTIVPLGLIVNELMSNSIEHAFKGSNKGVITVNMVQKDQSTFELTYVDNGSWTDKNTAEISFGLELVQALTDQLEGTVNREISPESTKYSFILKNLDIEK